MGCFADMLIDRQNEREFLPEDFDAWCRIEDLCDLCGYDPDDLFRVFPDIADCYGFPAGRVSEDYEEEHPMEALAGAVSRYLAEYPEKAEMRMTAAAEASVEIETEAAPAQPGRAA